MLRALKVLILIFLQGGKHDAFAKLIYIVDIKGEMVTDYISQPEDIEEYRKKLELKKDKMGEVIALDTFRKK